MATVGEWCDTHAEQVVAARPTLSRGQIRPRQASTGPAVFPVRMLLDVAGAGNAEQLALRLGVTPRSAHRWIGKQLLTREEADVVCTRAGLHPCEVWGEQWWWPDDLEDDEAADAA